MFSIKCIQSNRWTQLMNRVVDIISKMGYFLYILNHCRLPKIGLLEDFWIEDELLQYLKPPKKFTKEILISIWNAYFYTCKRFLDENVCT